MVTNSCSMERRSAIFKFQYFNVFLNLNTGKKILIVKICSKKKSPNKNNGISQQLLSQPNTCKTCYSSHNVFKNIIFRLLKYLPESESSPPSLTSSSRSIFALSLKNKSRTKSYRFSALKNRSNRSSCNSQITTRHKFSAAL